MITKNLAKAKMENLVVRLHFRSGKSLTCKVVKLLGIEIEVMVSKVERRKVIVNTLNRVERRKVIVNTLNRVEFVDEHISELA